MRPSPKPPASRSAPPIDPPADSPGDEALAEYMLRTDRGEVIDRKEFIRTHPEAAEELIAYFSSSISLDRMVDSISLPFGPELAPALEPIRAAASQVALDEDTADVVGLEPTAVIVVESGVNQAEPPVVDDEPPSGEVEIAPRPAAAWWWGAAAAALLAVGLAVFWRPPAIDPDEDADPPRPFVTENVKWEAAGPVVTLFDEDAQFAQLTPRNGLEFVVDQAFSGKKAIRIDRTVQCEALPGLPARIREKPGPGEYRYLRFAWKKPYGGSIALVLWGQMPGRRFHYFAGKRLGPTETVRSIRLSNSPRDWTMVERDLFADFGAINIVAMTLVTVPDQPAYFDAIRLTKVTKTVVAGEPAKGDNRARRKSDKAEKDAAPAAKQTQEPAKKENGGAAPETKGPETKGPETKGSVGNPAPKEPAAKQPSAKQPAAKPPTNGR